jgi:hypothetical protein
MIPLWVAVDHSSSIVNLNVGFPRRFSLCSHHKSDHFYTVGLAEFVVLAHNTGPGTAPWPERGDDDGIPSTECLVPNLDVK